MTSVRLITAGLMIAGLSACGGGSTGGGASSAASFQDLFDQADAIADATNTLQYTDPTTLPTGGSATYTGVIVVDAADLDRAAGTLALTANFANNQITGSVSNVVTEAEDSLVGTLSITNGSIDRAADVESDFTFDADLTGTLTDDTFTYEVGATMAGDFVHTDYGTVEGPVDGTVTVSGQVSVITEGAFIAER